MFAQTYLDMENDCDANPLSPRLDFDPGRREILHSRADETVPFADSEELVRNSGLPPEALVEVGFEHRLADEESLARMLRACQRRLK